VGEHAVAEHGHMQDFEAHVRAVEEDLEYWRTKRLEPRILFLARRGVVSIYDLMRAAATHTAEFNRERPSVDWGDDLERRIRALEDGLDEFVRAVTVIRLDAAPSGTAVSEDNRKEAGYYDPFFRISRPRRDGTLLERIERLEGDIHNYTTELRIFAAALIGLGLTSPEAMEHRRAELAEQGFRNAGKIVARAWLDEDFKRNLIATGREAMRELGIPSGKLGKLGVVENTDTVHHVVVCTLCSCYPYDLLGNPPWWYKDDSFRQRIVQDPRGTLAEMFQLNVPNQVEVQVHDSTSDVRWMVIPRRPAGTEGLSEEELAQLVTPDSVIGAAEALEPSQLADYWQTGAPT
jgi:nitrile hydratase